MMIFLSTRKYITKLIGNTVKMHYIGLNYSGRWQTKSFAIITYDTVPGDCTHRVICQIGDRALFERLATPRPAPKVMLKSNWLTQQQQQLTLKEGVNSIAKEIATWKSKAGVRDETKNATEVDMAAGNSRRTVSKVPISVNKKSSEMHSRSTKRTLKKSNE